MMVLVMVDLDIHIVEDDEQKEQAFSLRRRVFVEEQGVDPKIEFDGEDEHARHVVAVLDGRVVGCLRMVLEDEGICHPGRLAVDEEFRSRGVGSELMWFCIKDMKEQGFSSAVIHAQAYLKKFYEGFGFVAVGEPFMEAKIKHYFMVLSLRDD